MGAFGSFISGAGNAAGKYGEEVRGQRFQAGQAAKEAFARMIGEEADKRIYDPNTRNQLLQLKVDVLNNPLGKSMVPHVKTLHELTSEHPHNAKILDMLGGKPGEINLDKPDEQPGSSPVQPGSPLLQSPSGSSGSGGAQSAQAPQSAQSSQAPQSAVPQISDMIGMPPLTIPQQPAVPQPPPSPMAAQPAQSPVQPGSPPIPPVHSQSPLPQHSSQGNLLNLPMPEMPDIHKSMQPYLSMTGGVITPQVEQMALADWQNQLQTYRGAQQSQIEVNRKLALLEAFRHTPEGQRMMQEHPDWMSMMEGSAYGLTMAPGMMNSMTGSYSMNGIKTEDFAQQHPAEFAAAGIDPAKSPLLNVRYNRMMPGKPIQIEGKGIALHFGYDDQGNLVGINPITPGAIPPVQTGAVAPSLVAPHEETTATGSKEFTTAAHPNKVTPIGGGQPGVPVNPEFVPKTTSGTHTEIKDINGQLVPVQVSTSSTSKKGGGSAGGASVPIAPVTPAAPVPAGKPSVSPTTSPVKPAAGPHVGPHVGVGQPLGASQGTFRMQAENPLTPGAQKVMEETQPVLDMMQRVEKMLEPFKDSKMPASTLLPRIAYSLGYGGDTGALLSALELSRITQAAAVLKGSGSRARQILERAMVHTPNAWVDSPKLMMDKLKNIEVNIQAIQHAAGEFGKHYPGLDRANIPPVEGGGNNNPSAGNPTHRYNPSTGQIEIVK